MLIINTWRAQDILCVLPDNGGEDNIISILSILAPSQRRTLVVIVRSAHNTFYYTKYHPKNQHSVTGSATISDKSFQYIKRYGLCDLSDRKFRFIS